MKIQKETLDFLRDLKNNNNREWFAEQKGLYQSLYSDFKLFALELEAQLKAIDQIEKTHLFRIYRDVRFSKDKSPYKQNFGVSYSRSKPMLRGGYYLHIEPDNNSFIACGFWNPNADDLFRMRKEIEFNEAPLIDILGNKSFKDTFGILQGTSLKKAPKGFDNEHTAIDLIKMKQFIAMKKLKDEEVCGAMLLATIIEAYRVVRPFFDYMSDALSTDLNGEPIF